MRGATISVANVRKAGDASGVHGTYKPPCDVCQPLIDYFGIEDKNGYINGYEYDYKVEYISHEVYSDGTYIYDPRYANVPALKYDYFRALREINPDGFDVFTKQ